MVKKETSTDFPVNRTGYFVLSAEPWFGFRQRPEFNSELRREMVPECSLEVTMPTMSYRKLEKIARENSGGDPVVAEILLQNLQYNYGKGRNGSVPRMSEPSIIDGVKFWRVGHNASHEFYAGTDGKGNRFSRSVGESLTIDLDGNPLEWDEERLWYKTEPGLDVSVEKVTDWSGYYGHF